MLSFPAPLALTITFAALLLALAALIWQRREQRDAEEARLRLEGVFDATGFGVIQIDADDRIEYANAVAAETLGFRVDDLIGHDKHSLLHATDDPEDDGSSVCPVREALRDGRPYFGQDYFRRRDGTRLPVTVSTAPLGGGSGGAMLAFRDRTADVEREAEASERFEMISHELRSPLTSIVGFSRRLDRAVRAGTLAATEDQAEEVALLAREAERMRDTVTVLLGLARIDTGTLDVDPSPVSLRSLVEEEVERAERAGSPVTVTVVAEVAPVIETDERMVRQVLQVLLDNAAKHAGPEPRMEIAITESDTDVRLTVTDDGPGIPEEMHARVFGRFARGSGEGARHGLGLGLHIAKRVAYASGAELTFDAAYDGGARFHLRIPRSFEAHDPAMRRQGW